MIFRFFKTLGGHESVASMTNKLLNGRVGSDHRGPVTVKQCLVKMIRFDSSTGILLFPRPPGLHEGPCNVSGLCSKLYIAKANGETCVQKAPVEL